MGETPKIRTHFTLQENNINEWLRCFETHAWAATIFMPEKNTPRAQVTLSTTIHIEFRHFFMHCHLLEPKTTQIQTYHQVALWTNEQILTFCGPQSNYSRVKQCWAGITFLEYPTDKNIHLSFIP